MVLDSIVKVSLAAVVLLTSFTARAEYPITIVDSQNRWTHVTRIENLTFYEKKSPIGYAFGRLKIQSQDPNFVDTQISTYYAWNARFLHEALAHASLRHPILLKFYGDGPDDGAAERTYSIYDVKIQVGSSKPIPLDQFLYSWKRYQEQLLGRYYGVGGTIREFWDHCSSLLGPY